MKKTYTYKKKKQNRKIIIFPLMLLVIVGIVVGISTLTKKETKAGTTDQWICKHQSYEIVSTSIGTTEFKHSITIRCKDCSKYSINIDGECLGYFILEEKISPAEYIYKCSVCNRKIDIAVPLPTSSIQSSSCLHPSSSRSISFEFETNQACKTIKIKCSKCNKVLASDSRSQHTFDIPATCHAQRICVICGQTDSSAFNTNNHLINMKEEKIGNWLNNQQHTRIEWCHACGKDINTINENHTEASEWTVYSSGHAKLCTICKGKIKEYNHNMVAANCSTPPYCRTCNYIMPGTSAVSNAHIDDDNDGICDECKKTIQSAETPPTCTHPSSKVDPATCKKGKYCKECRQTISDPIDHDYSEATCTKAATCSMCGTTKGQPNGHQYDTTTGEKIRI